MTTIKPSSISSTLLKSSPSFEKNNSFNDTTGIDDNFEDDSF